MTIFEILDARLQALRDKGSTNQAIANDSRLSQPYINQILNHKTKLENVAFGKVLKLFPDIQRVLERHLEGSGGGHVAIDHSIAGNNIQASPAADLDAYRGRLCLALAAADGIDPASLKTALNVIRATE